MNMPFAFNVDDICQALKIPKPIYLRIVAKAVAQTESDIPAMEAALPMGNFEQIQSISHRLKGDYGNLRIMSLSNVSRQINEVSKTTQDKDQVCELLREFKQDFGQLQQALKTLA